MSTVECRSILKRYGAQEVIRDFNLEISDHEFVVFLGPSGCGKSTILRMIAGLEEITGGDLLIGGQRVNDRDPGDRGIAMVFQNYALYPHMTVREKCHLRVGAGGHIQAGHCRPTCTGRHGSGARDVYDTQTVRIVGRPATTRCNCASNDKDAGSVPFR